MDNAVCSWRRFPDGDSSAFDAIMDELFFGVVFFVNRYVGDVHASTERAESVRIRTSMATVSLKKSRAATRRTW